MTPQEAIRRIRDHNEVHSVRERNFAVYITEALNMAVDALKRQIPMKPKISIKGTTGWNTKCYCPNCHSFISTGKYCHECGQALDWGDTE